MHDGPEIDPLIVALLARLPSPGESFAERDRDAWMRALDAAFDVIYAPVRTRSAVEPARA